MGEFVCECVCMCECVCLGAREYWEVIWSKEEEVYFLLCLGGLKCGYEEMIFTHIFALLTKIHNRQNFFSS